MAVSVRRVNFDADKEELLALLQMNLPNMLHARRFEWLYRDNPDGPARSWFACQGEKIVGVTSVFPRSIWVGGQLKLCGQVGDFAIAASHRSLGPAVMMQRATLQPVDDGNFSFCYDCPPHEAGMTPFRRLGMQPSVAVRRYALPLRMERQLIRRFGFTPPVVTAIGNFLLRSLTRRAVRVPDLQVSEFTDRFDDEFTLLDDSLQSVDAIRGRRSAAHLNWRYRDDPLNKYRVLAARRRGELLAYLVFSTTGDDVTIVDLLGRELSAAAIALLHAVPGYCGVRCQNMESYLSEQSDLIPVFLKARFSARSVAAQVVAYAKPESETSIFLKGRARWALHAADIRA